MGHQDWLEEALAIDVQAGDVGILLGQRAAVMAYDGVRVAAPPAPPAAERCCGACGRACSGND